MGMIAPRDFVTLRRIEVRLPSSAISESQIGFLCFDCIITVIEYCTVLLILVHHYSVLYIVKSFVLLLTLLASLSSCLWQFLC